MHHHPPRRIICTANGAGCQRVRRRACQSMSVRRCRRRRLVTGKCVSPHAVDSIALLFECLAVGRTHTHTHTQHTLWLGAANPNRTGPERRSPNRIHSSCSQQVTTYTHNLHEAKLVHYVPDGVWRLIGLPNATLDNITVCVHVHMSVCAQLRHRSLADALAPTHQPPHCHFSSLWICTCGV